MKQQRQIWFILMITISLASCSMSQYKNLPQGKQIIANAQRGPENPCAWDEIWTENNKWVEIRCLGSDKKLQEDIFGVAIRKQRYSGEYMIESSHYGRDERLKEDIHGIAILRFKWENGKKMEVRRYGADGNLKEDTDGIAIGRNFYDKDGNWIESRNYDIDDKLKEGKMGVAVVRFKRDGYGRVIELSYYDIDGKLTEDRKSGCALERMQWNDEGHSIKKECLDRDLKLVFKE